ncbi:hypothetical protein HYDPIDRAFT_174542 [Hydnomerulius pinastri MD-312]|nr:hypothetical protein HYDPIDRAFT_174542 [Hydnomerulius pinastri MD-312]
MVGLTKERYAGYRHPFLNGKLYAGGVGDNPRTMTDLAMSHFSAFIRREIDWWKYIHDPNTRARWTTEGLGHTWTVRAPSTEVGVWLTASQEGGFPVEYVLNELGGYAQLRDLQHRCQVSCYDRIWESDSLLSESATASFNSSIAALPNMRSLRTSEDGELELTYSILDPSLYCLIFGRTLAYDPSDPKLLRPEPPPRGYDPENASAVSKQRVYLPTDFGISPSGTVKAKAYINNLHPRHKALYCRFEEILSKSVPLFEHVLTDLHIHNHSEPRIKSPASLIYLEEPEPPEFRSDDLGWANYEARKRRYSKNPGGPSYEGSPWQVQGMKNERIVACAYYYVSVENIKGNVLEFRAAVKLPQPFPSGHRETTIQLWGLAHNDPCHQYLGSVPIRDGLCVALPNIYQHRHSAFSLSDPSRPGYQRVVGIFLVDPDIQPIPSTARVPPQQKSWARKGIEESKLFAVELVDKIMFETEGLTDAAEAELGRKAILMERTDFRARNDQQYFCVPC